MPWNEINQCYKRKLIHWGNCIELLQILTILSFQWDYDNVLDLYCYYKTISSNYGFDWAILDSYDNEICFFPSKMLVKNVQNLMKKIMDILDMCN